MPKGQKSKEDSGSPCLQCRQVIQENLEPFDREAIQKLQHRWRHPAEERPEEVCQVAQVRASPASEEDSLPATEGSSQHQPVHTDIGQADCHQPLQAPEEVQTRDRCWEEANCREVWSEPRDGSDREEESSACSYRSRRGPCRAGGLDAGSLQEDEHPLLYRQGQGSTRPSRPQEDGCCSCCHFRQGGGQECTEQSGVLSHDQL